MADRVADDASECFGKLSLGTASEPVIGFTQLGLVARPDSAHQNEQDNPDEGVLRRMTGR